MSGQSLKQSETLRTGAPAAGSALVSAQRTRNLGQTMDRLLDPTQVTPLANELVGTLLTVPTGYAGNDVVEPAILYDATASHLGYEYVLCIAPYYQSNAAYENPCLWVSHDGTSWIPLVNGVPTPNYAGTATPVYGQGNQGDGNVADPFLCQGPDGTYYILWYQALNSTGAGGTGVGSNNSGIKITKAASLAGPWSTPVSVQQSAYTGSGSYRPENPSMFWDGSTWHLYMVDLGNTSATTIVHYTNPAADPTTGSFTKQSNPVIPIPSAYSTQVWWHLNAYYAGSQHVLLIQDSVAGSSAGGNLWIATSNDGGTTWSVPSLPCVPSSGNKIYRSAMIFTADGGIDLFYGRWVTNWELRRARLMIAGPLQPKYGGVTAAGIPVNAEATSIARIPLAPYAFGDAVARADSSTSPGSADSGQAYTVSAGTVGVASKQLYAPAASNSRAALTTTGCADGVTTAEFSARETAAQAWLITRFADANNYVRFGQNPNYTAQNIVAAGVAQTASLAAPAPADGDVLAIFHQGSTVSFYVNGILVGTATGWSSNATASGVGVQFTGTVGRIRNITQRSLKNGQ